MKQKYIYVFFEKFTNIVFVLVDNIEISKNLLIYNQHQYDIIPL